MHPVIVFLLLAAAALSFAAAVYFDEGTTVRGSRVDQLGFVALGLLLGLLPALYDAAVRAF